MQVEGIAENNKVPLNIWTSIGEQGWLAKKRKGSILVSDDAIYVTQKKSIEMVIVRDTRRTAEEKVGPSRHTPNMSAYNTTLSRSCSSRRPILPLLGSHLHQSTDTPRKRK